MSSNERFSSPKNIKEITFNRLKTISKSIDINNIHKDKNRKREMNSIFNFKKNFNNLNNQITTNTHSIVNIFNINKKMPLIKKLDSPTRINLSKNSNNNIKILEVLLVEIYYCILQKERKIILLITILNIHFLLIIVLR
jgi:hypothetical protein